MFSNLVFLHIFVFWLFLFSWCLCCCIVSSGCNHFSFALFKVVVSMYRRYVECWRVIFLLLFLTHTVCRCHLCILRPFASSWVFLFSSPFVEVLTSTLKMVPSILRGGQFSYLSPWCYLAWFPAVFSFSWSIIFIFLSSPLVWWCPLPLFLSICKFPFLRAFRFFLNLVVLFLPSYDAFYY